MRYRTLGCLLVSMVVVVSLTAPIWAHHSFSAQYDSSKPVNLTGAVTKIEWMNPHVYFYIDVRDEQSGKIDNWAFEMGAPAVIQRNGWTRNSMKIGDIVVVEGTRAKSGATHGNARSVTMKSTGKKLGAGSSENVTP